MADEDIDSLIGASLAHFTDSMQKGASERFRAMRDCSFFARVGDEDLMRLAENSEVEQFKDGEYITREGTPADVFFVILFGEARVSVNQVGIGKIASGECIGERAFFAERPLSSATVVASGELMALEIRKSTLDAMDADLRDAMSESLLHALFRKLEHSNRLVERLLDELRRARET